MSGSARGSKKTGKFSGNARAVVFTSRITKVADSSAVVGSLKSFVPNDLLGSFKDWIEYPEPEEGEVHSTWHSPCATPSEASVGLPELDRDRVRRRVERQGDRLMRQRLACGRHEQLKELVELLPPAAPQLSRAARQAKEKKLREEAERAREEAERLYREARRGYALRRFRAAGFAVLRKLRLGDDDFFAWLNNTAVLPISKRESGKGQEAARQCAEGSEPFHHHLRHVRREELTPRHAARRQELTERGNFSPSFIVGLEVKPRVDAQPLLAFMEQGDFISTVEQKVDSDSEHRILSRRFRALRGREARGDPRAPVEEPTSKAAKRSTKPGEVSVKFAHVVRVGRTKMQRLLELLDPQRAVGHVAADALVPLMFWLGLTKSRTAALETLRMGFGSLQIDLQALLVMGEHVEVQMRLVDGLRQLIRRESLEQLCEYITSNGFQRLRAWFNSMRADQFGCVDITQVQSLFARMEVTTDRQTLFRLLSYIIENPHPTAAKDPSEAIAIEKKKFSLQGFGSLLCRCAASWVLHRVMSMLEAPENNRRPSEQDVAMRWIQLQRRIMISLMVNQRFWGRESRQVLGHLQPPQIAMEEMEALTPEQWNLLFQRVRAQGLAAVLPSSDLWSTDA